MSELAETFDAWNEQKRIKKRSNMDSSTACLEMNGIKFTSHNNGVHLIVEKKFDFYPSTGKFIDRESKKQGRGVKNLMSLINSRSKNDE